MYKSMVFYQDPFNSELFSVRAARIKPFKQLDAAIRAVKRVGHGYVVPQGKKTPCWTNVQ